MPPLNVESTTPSTNGNRELEVDFDKNVTALYEAISNSQWELALKTIQSRPTEARTWVVRHDNAVDSEAGTSEEGRVLWRFLPIHSACARQPPENVVAALLRAFSQGATAADDQGMYPLHYACGNQASGEVIRLLLLSNPAAAAAADPHGMLPIHYMAQWGPSGPGVVDMLLFSNRNVADAKDIDGNTPLDLAKEGDYPQRDEVINALSAIEEDVSVNVPAPSSSTTGRPTVGAGSTRSAPMAERGVFRDPEDREQPPKETTKTTTKKASAFKRSVNPMVTAATTTTAAIGDEKESKSAQKTVSKLKAEITKLQAERAFVEAELEERFESERTELQDEIDLTKSKLDQTSGEVKKLTRNLDEVNETLSSTEANLAKRDDELDDSKKACEKLKRDLKIARSANDDLKKELFERDEELRTTTSALMDTKSELNSTKNNLDGVTSDLEAAVASNTELTTENAEKDEAIKQKESTLVERNYKLFETEKTVKKLTTELEMTTSERNELKEKCGKLEEHLTILSKSLSCMLDKQERVMQAALRQEEHMKRAAAVRQRKLEELMQHEARVSQLAIEKEKVEFSDDSSVASVRDALQAQKEEIQNVAAILKSASDEE